MLISFKIDRFCEKNCSKQVSKTNNTQDTGYLKQHNCRNKPLKFRLVPLSFAVILKTLKTLKFHDKIYEIH